MSPLYILFPHITLNLLLFFFTHSTSIRNQGVLVFLFFFRVFIPFRLPHREMFK